MSVQVVIVTGAASGIGAAIALSFAKLNAGLIITDINEPDLHKTSIECQEISRSKVLKVAADVRKDEDLENIVKCALKEFGKIDVLVNCAGIHKSTYLQNANAIEKFDEIISINLRSVVVMSKKALPALIESKGCIINLSSVCSTLFVSGCIMYTIAKAGVTTFTKCAALELASQGVRVNCISPGPVKTNILKNAGIGEREGNDMWDGYVDMVPLKKIVKAEEIAEMAVYLASDKAASITGADFVVDGGMKLGTC